METDRVGQVNQDAWITAEMSDKEELIGLFRQDPSIEIVGIKYCTSQAGYLENIGIMIGGKGLGRIA